MRPVVLCEEHAEFNETIEVQTTEDFDITPTEMQFLNSLVNSTAVLQYLKVRIICTME